MTGRDPRPLDYWVWEETRGGTTVRFVGRGPAADLDAVLRETGGSSGRCVSWLRQVHSAQVLTAAPEECGTGDALWTRRHDLALAVKTADCVPVLLGGAGRVAAVHAGWRGIAAGVVAAALAAMDGDPRTLTAWIGPAIGPCCYEVDPQVAQKVAAASSPDIVRMGDAGKPHLDLPAAVAHQLRGAGVTELRALSRCTRCEDAFFSYRRSGGHAGRNLSFVWMSSG